MFDYIVIAFFAAFLGLKYVQTKATGHLWFLLPLLLILGLNQGWGNIFKGESFGEAFFLFYRLLTLASCFFACYMYFRDYRKREIEVEKIIYHLHPKRFAVASIIRRFA